MATHPTDPLRQPRRGWTGRGGAPLRTEGGPGRAGSRPGRRAPHPELPVDALEVAVHRAHRDHQVVGHLLAGGPGRHPLGHLSLRGRSGAGARPPRPAAACAGSRSPPPAPRLSDGPSTRSGGRGATRHLGPGLPGIEEVAHLPVAGRPPPPGSSTASVHQRRGLGGVGLDQRVGGPRLCHSAMGLGGPHPVVTPGPRGPGRAGRPPRRGSSPPPGPAPPPRPAAPRARPTRSSAPSSQATRRSSSGRKRITEWRGISAQSARAVDAAARSPDAAMWAATRPAAG